MKVSVNQQLVIMKGCDIGCDAYDKYDIDDCMEKYDADKKKEGIVIIKDGMDGDYCFVGIVTIMSDRYEPIEDIGTQKIESIDEETVVKIQKFIEEKFKIKNAKIDNFLFIHYN